ncbi:hypothetical protein QUF64_04380 [Anaerolineales bacterium HSG6]|nr:hypothetical protein [Anaerolineales bacterium HSG6]
MKLIDIKDGTITIELNPPMCQVLLNMSRTACQHTNTEALDQYQLLAAFFHACCIASYSQWHISAETAEIVNEQLMMVGLREQTDATHPYDYSSIR